MKKFQIFAFTISAIALLSAILPHPAEARGMRGTGRLMSYGPHGRHTANGAHGSVDDNAINRPAAAGPLRKTDDSRGTAGWVGKNGETTARPQSPRAHGSLSNNRDDYSEMSQ